MRSAEPTYLTFLLHHDEDVEAAVAAYATEGWQRDTGRDPGPPYDLLPTGRHLTTEAPIRALDSHRISMRVRPSRCHRRS